MRKSIRIGLVGLAAIGAPLGGAMAQQKVVEGFVSYYDTWHHYSTSGNWSLGYVEFSSPIIRGYIPRSLLEYDIGNNIGCHQ